MVFKPCKVKKKNKKKRHVEAQRPQIKKQKDDVNGQKPKEEKKVMIDFGHQYNAPRVNEVERTIIDRVTTNNVGVQCLG